MSRFDGLGLQPPIEPMEAATATRFRWVTAGCTNRNGTVSAAWRFAVDADVELRIEVRAVADALFPEIVAALLGDRGPALRRWTANSSSNAAADFDFDALLQRIHPAASRVAHLSKQTPAKYAVFDLLVDEEKHAAATSARSHRAGAALESFAKRYFRRGRRWPCRRRRATSPRRARGSQATSPASTGSSRSGSTRPTISASATRS